MSTSLNIQLAPNKPEIVSEKFEDEYILVSLVNGNYYSLRGTAAGLWTHIEGNCNAKALMSAYEKQYDLSPEDVKSLEDFINDLIDQNLVKTNTAQNLAIAVCVPQTRYWARWLIDIPTGGLPAAIRLSQYHAPNR